jgi:hypothetical protein
MGGREGVYCYIKLLGSPKFRILFSIVSDHKVKPRLPHYVYSYKGPNLDKWSQIAGKLQKV